MAFARSWLIAAAAAASAALTLAPAVSADARPATVTGPAAGARAAGLLIMLP
jgi:hypothetical protein